MSALLIFSVPCALLARAKQIAAAPLILKANGKIAFQEAINSSFGGYSNICIMDADGSNKTTLLKGFANDTAVLLYEFPAYSPDGSKIAFERALISDSGFDVQIYTMNADGSNLIRLTDTHDSINGQPVINSLPAWSPDGKRIAFVRGHVESDADNFVLAFYAVYTMDADGTNVQKLTDDDLANEFPAWSPDGAHIAYSSNCNHTNITPITCRSDVYVMNADGSNKTNITRNGSSNLSPSWSPDGKKLVFASAAAFSFQEPSAINIFVINADGTGLNRLTASPDGTTRFIGNVAPQWSPDGKKIAFISDREGNPDIYIMNADGSSQTRITNTISDNGYASALSWQPIPLATPPAEIDTAQGFVTQQYRDFLNREPDADGFNFWTREILSCGGDAACVDAKRANVSAAFFLSIEFQQTGYLVHRLYKAAYGRAPRFDEFLPDTQSIAGGVIVNQTGWEQKLEQNKQNFISDFINRAAFKQLFPDALTPAQFIDALNANTNNALSPTERDALVSGLTCGAETRATALRKVAENTTFARREFNPAFVLMQYFGYLRRNPQDPPDNNLDGYDFWLKKLNDFNGDYIRSEMVRSFIVSDEYRRRFAQP